MITIREDQVAVLKEEQWINPVNGIITSSCGKRENPILKKIELHDGLDIAVPEDTGAKAVRSGTVTVVRNSQTLGNLVTYKTEDGYEITFAHLNQVLVQPGEKVKQGQIIAKTGNTGLSTGPHLHYSVKKEGMLYDPFQFVTLSYTDEVKAEYEWRGASLDEAK